MPATTLLPRKDSVKRQLSQAHRRRYLHRYARNSLRNAFWLNRKSSPNANAKATMTMTKSSGSDE